ncbi:cytochrome c oxidase subunit 3 [Nevskia sp.]|uniref:cytochrome c oxidase subunit 3 n=1 Tax=Nevskia sp. TaxID=1929292 RepID=UPI0025F05628|nr:cytochrome c oxidase subunit 3 [Nevskia sp.]
MSSTRGNPAAVDELKGEGDTSADPPAIWTFIVLDSASFAVFFAVFMAERLAQPALFDASSRLLDVRLGLTNTLILITSSWLVALAVAAGRRGDLRRLRAGLLGGILVGSAFAVLKLIEYITKLAGGITPQTNDFFGYYFCLTGIHFVHYLAGMIVLLVLLARARKSQAVDPELMGWAVSGGIFWHLIDLLWVFLFPLLYLLGRVK